MAEVDHAENPELPTQRLVPSAPKKYLVPALVLNKNSDSITAAVAATWTA